MSGVDCKKTPRSLHDWPGPTASWWCHCCNRLNDLRSRRCKTCGRSAAYGKMKPPANTTQRKSICSQTSSLHTLFKLYIKRLNYTSIMLALYSVLFRYFPRSTKYNIRVCTEMDRALPSPTRLHNYAPH